MSSMTLEERFEALMKKFEAVTSTNKELKNQKEELKSHNECFRCHFKEKRQPDLNDHEVKVPKFEGKLDPDEFLRWLYNVERIFDYHKVPEEMKVKLVALRLRKYASIWWTNLCAMRVRGKKSKIQTWKKMKSKLRNRFLPHSYLHEKERNQAHKAKHQQKAKQFKKDFPEPTVITPSFPQKEVPEPAVIPLSTPQKDLAPQKNQIGLEASDEVVKEVNEDKDGDVVLDLSDLNGIKEETLSSDELNDEKGANESSRILSSSQGFELEQEEIKSELQHGTEPCNQKLTLENQEEVVEKVEEEETLILENTLSEFHDLGEQNKSESAYKSLNSMNNTPRFELKQTKIEYKLQQENKQLDSLLANDKPLKKVFYHELVKSKF